MFSQTWKKLKDSSRVELDILISFIIPQVITAGNGACDVWYRSHIPKHLDSWVNVSEGLTYKKWAWNANWGSHCFRSSALGYFSFSTTQLRFTNDDRAFYFFAGPEHFAVVLGEPRLSAGVFGIVETVDVKKAGKQYISALRAFLHVRERRLGLIKYGVLYETFHPSVHLVTLRVLPGLQ